MTRKFCSSAVDPLLLVLGSGDFKGMSSTGAASESNDSPVSSRSNSWAVASARFAWITRCGRLVMSSARFLHVCDRDQADLEALVRLFELSREGFERRLCGVDRVLGGQHVEIALRGALNEILLRGLVVRFGLRNLARPRASGRTIGPSETQSAGARSVMAFVSTVLCLGHGSQS